MNLSYQAVNPDSGDCSFLLRFQTQGGENPTILVDPGKGVDVSNQLRPGDYLAGVLLTHLHRDHYSSLPENVHAGTRIYTSAINRTLLEDVFVDCDHVDQPTAGEWATAGSFDTIQTPSTWTRITDEIHVRLLPVGHAFGATGFAVRFPGEMHQKHIMITGDLSLNNVAGMPGAPTNIPFQPDVLFANAPKNALSQENAVTDILGEILKQRQDSCVLVGASSLVSIQFALLLDKILQAATESFDIVLVGLAAAIHEALDFETGIRTYPQPSEVESLAKPGTVLFAGAENLEAGYAEQIHHYLSQVGGTTLQVVGHERSEEQRQRNSTIAYQYSQHPTEGELLKYITRLDPIHVIFGHGGSDELSGRVRDCITWQSKGDTSDRALYTDGDGWVGPPWLSQSAVRAILQKRRDKVAFSPDAEWPLPEFSQINLQAEGVSLSRLPAETIQTEPADQDSGTAGLDASSSRRQGAETKYDTTTTGTMTTATAVEIEDGVVLLNPDEIPESVEDGDELRIRFQ
jgi:putative mRNA 3-end processing factor